MFRFINKLTGIVLAASLSTGAHSQAVYQSAITIIAWCQLPKIWYNHGLWRGCPMATC